MIKEALSANFSEFFTWVISGLGAVLIFLVILWIGKVVSKRVGNYLGNFAVLERFKVEGVMDFPKIIYYLLMLVTWYIALTFIGIDLTIVVKFILTNLTIFFAVALAAFGLAWALSKKSQTQANKIITSIAGRAKAIFFGFNK